MSNSSTDGSNNNQNFQTFLQDYLSDLIENPPPTERNRPQSSRNSRNRRNRPNIWNRPMSSNYYMNPLYARAQSMPLNLFIPNAHLDNIEISGSSIAASRYAYQPLADHVVDIEWGNFMESMLQNQIPINSGSMRPYLDRLLQRSLNTSEKQYKMVLSEKGKEQIKRLPYIANDFKEQQFCPISQKEFQEGEEIALLPCSHIFEPDNIMKWLEKENATCPVCRYKLKSIEKKRIPHTHGEADDDDLPDLEPIPPQTTAPTTAARAAPSSATSTQPTAATDARGIDRLINSLRFLNLGTANMRDPSSARTRAFQRRRRPSSFIPASTQTNRLLPQLYNLLRREETVQEEEDLQAALMASLETYAEEEEKNSSVANENLLSSGDDVDMEDADIEDADIEDADIEDSDIEDLD